jgi:hypothetical protein
MNSGLNAQIVTNEETTTTGALRAPVGRAEGEPLLFSLYVPQETGMHQTWVCTTKSAALEGPFFWCWCIYVGPSLVILFGRYVVANNREWSLFGREFIKPTPHDFNSNIVHCTSHIANCTLCIEHCTSHVAHCTLHIAHRSAHIAHNTSQIKHTLVLCEVTRRHANDTLLRNAMLTGVGSMELQSLHLSSWIALGVSSPTSLIAASCTCSSPLSSQHHAFSLLGSMFDGEFTVVCSN